TREGAARAGPAGGGERELRRRDRPQHRPSRRPLRLQGRARRRARKANRPPPHPPPGGAAAPPGPPPGAPPGGRCRGRVETLGGGKGDKSGARLVASLLRRLGACPRRFAISVPYLWLVAFFLLPFFIVFKISMSTTEIAQPPYVPVFDPEAGFAGLKEFLAAL